MNCDVRAGEEDPKFCEEPDGRHELATERLDAGLHSLRNEQELPVPGTQVHHHVTVLESGQPSHVLCHFSRSRHVWHAEPQVHRDRQEHQEDEEDQKAEDDIDGENAGSVAGAWRALRRTPHPQPLSQGERGAWLYLDHGTANSLSLRERVRERGKKNSILRTSSLVLRTFIAVPQKNAQLRPPFPSATGACRCSHPTPGSSRAGTRSLAAHCCSPGTKRSCNRGGRRPSSR